MENVSSDNENLEHNVNGKIMQIFFLSSLVSIWKIHLKSERDSEERWTEFCRLP